MADMGTSKTCQNCGAPLADDAHQGFCPKCLFREASAAACDENQKSEGNGQKVGGQEHCSQDGALAIENRESKIENGFGDYQLLEVIGRGGMGLVYRARQRSLDRVVAIKMMAFGPGSSPELVKRFRAEALAAAALQHPNIVAIHEVGIHEGRHFFVMDYVDGRSLADLVGNQPMPARRAAEYLKTIAEAVQYAHERGILHRDLKPSNVLVDGQGRPHVVDFGLARRLEGDSELTVTGQVLGSPHYLPPEQATARRGRVSRRTDVYGLGATLYHLLTGRPPFQGESLAQTLDLVLHSEPVAPRLLNSGLPRDLTTICLKCLEKEPAKRYPTAQAVADELGRFLAGQPILARPLGTAGKAWRWCRRNPQVAGLGALAALAFLLGIAGVLGEWRRAEAGELSAQRRAYISEIYSAQQALKANNPGRALELLGRHRRPLSAPSTLNPKPSTELRGFEWRYLWQQCQSDAEAVVGKLPSAVWSVEVSADGQWLLGSSRGGGVKVWNLASGEEIPLTPERGVTACATFSPDGRRLLFGDQSPQSFGTIAVWDLQARKRLAPITNPHPVGPMAFSPDGTCFGYGIALSSSGKDHFGRGVVVLRAYPSRDKVKEVICRTDIVDPRQGWDWVFTSDSRFIIFAESDPDCRLVLCDLVLGSEPRSFPGHREPITAMAISPDGHLLATGAGYTDKDIRLWDLPSFRLSDKLPGHEGWISALRFSPDGQTLASASGDQTIRLWDVATRKPVRVYDRLPGLVSRLCFTPDGQKLFSGTDDGTIHRWAVSHPQPKSESGFWRGQPGLDSVTLTPDGKRFAGLRQGGVYVGEVRSATPPGELPGLGTNNTCLLYSPDGRCLIAGTQGGEVQVWSLDDGKCSRRLPGPPEPVTRLRQDNQGRILVVMHWPNAAQLGLPVRVAVWNTAGWRQQKAWTFSGSTSSSDVFSGCEVSPDGRWLVTAGVRGPVQVWSLTDASEPRSMSSPGGTYNIALSPDGRFLTAATAGGVVRVWRMPGLREFTRFQARSQAIHALAFSPDSRRLATGGEGKEAINLWDVATWQELMAWELPGESMERIAFSADDSALLAENDKGDVLVWRVPSFAEIEAKEKNERTR